MKTFHDRSLQRVAMMGLMAGLMVGGGCREKDDEYEIVQLEGKVESIRANPDGTGEVTVSYHSEKHGQELSGSGIVTKETEIMINGVLSKLADIKEGERIRGEVRVETKNGERRQIALKIYVDRATAVGG